MHGADLFGTPPWRRAPRLLFSHPGLLLAVLAGAFVAVLPAASAPLFLSGARTAALHHQIDNTCAARVGLSVESTLGLRSGSASVAAAVDAASAAATYARRHATVGREVAATPGLTAPTTTLVGHTAVKASSRGDLGGATFWLVGRSDGFEGRLRVRQGPAGRGLWLPESFATAHGLTVGDVVETATLRKAPGMFAPPVDPAAPSLPLPVAAVYTDLGPEVTGAYWCTMQSLYGYRAGALEVDTILLPVVFTDLDTMVQVAVGSATNVMTEYIDVELADRYPTAPRAHVLADRVADLRARLAPAIPHDYGWLRPSYLSAIGHDARRAELVYRTLRGTTVPASAAGVLIGLVVVVAAAGYWIQRRERELRVLAVHGVGPAALAWKAVAEMLPAVLVGAVAAVVAGRALVTAVGPSPLLSGEAGPRAVAAGVGCALVCVLTIWVAVRLRLRRLVDAPPAGQRRRLSRLPWELVPLAAAPVLWWVVGARNEHLDQPGGVGSVAHVPVRLVVVPVVVFVALVVLAGRLVGRWITRPRPAARLRPAVRPAVLLARRRIARPAAASVALAAATAIPVALALFSATVTGSIRLTLDAKAAMIIGSDTVATVERPGPVPATVADRGTAVLRLSGASAGGLQIDVLGVDPATFGRGAFWHPQLPGPDLADLAAGLRAGAEPTGLVYGGLPSGRYEVKLHGQPFATVDVTAVDLLPGAQGGYPILLVHRDSLGRAAGQAVPQIWVRGAPVRTAAQLHAADLPLRRLAQSTGGHRDTLYEPVTYTFQYLIALDVFAGLVVVAGLLLYVEARTPTYQRGYVLLRRFGLRRGTHLLALLLETAVPMAVGLGMGLLLAALAAWVGRGDLDLAASTPPGPLLAVPVGVLVTVLVVVTAVAVLSGGFAHLRSASAEPGEVLRVAG